MSKTRFAVLGLAIGSAALAGFLAMNFLGKEPEERVIEVNRVETSKVLVVAKDVKMGDQMGASRLKWQEWPKEVLKPFMITQKRRPKAMEELEKARARAAMFEGEPISEKKLLLPNGAGFMAALLPKGMRAIAVRVGVEQGAGGFILPNDKVDVLLTRKLGNSGTGRTITETVLQNVRILAIDQTYNQDNDKDKVAIKPQGTATLEVEPRQAEVLAFAEQIGQLSLALRALADNGDSDLGDDGPRLSPKYARGGNGEISVLRYGIQKSTAANE